MRPGPLRLASHDKSLLVAWAEPMDTYSTRMHYDWQQDGWTSEPSDLRHFIHIFLVLTLLFRLASGGEILLLGCPALATGIF